MCDKNKLECESKMERVENRTSNSFRNILLRMNSQVKQSKKRKFRSGKDEEEFEVGHMRKLTVSTSYGHRGIKYST